MLTSNSFDVIIAGGGVTGLSSAFHLRQCGITRIALSCPYSFEQSVSTQAAGIASGGQSDNFSRLVVTHGVDLATKLWKFGDKAFDLFENWCLETKVPFQKNSRIRIITTEHEHNESTKAISLFANAGFTDKFLTKDRTLPLFRGITDRAMALQYDGSRGAWFNTKAVINSLKSVTSKIKKLPPIVATNFRKEKNRLQVVLQDGSTAYCHTLVVATHLHTKNILPGLAPHLISVSDQWCEIKVNEITNENVIDPGIVFSLNHNHEWGASTQNSSIIYGGARYLRPSEGVEAESASVESKITQHLLTLAKRSFHIDKNSSVTKTIAALECRPSDELPLIGPISSTSNILIATGFMGQGMTQGFLAGSCLANLIATGASKDLPRELWPERLRDL